MTPLRAARAPEHRELPTSKGVRGPGGDLVRGRGPGAPLPRAASSERLPSSSSGSGTRRDGAGRSMGLAGSGGGQRLGGQRLHALAGPGQPTRVSCAPRSIIPPGGGAAGAGPAGTLPPSRTAQLERAATRTLLPGCWQRAKLLDVPPTYRRKVT